MSGYILNVAAYKKERTVCGQGTGVYVTTHYRVTLYFRGEQVWQSEAIEEKTRALEIRDEISARQALDLPLAYTGIL